MVLMAKIRKIKALMAICIFMLLSVCGCTPSLDSYLGTWVGIDENNPKNIVVYEYQIAEAGENQLSISVIRKAYELSQSNEYYIWTESIPRYFPAVYNPKDKGIVSTPFGLLKYDIGVGNIKYGNITFVKKAKNTELKLKYVARKAVKEMSPKIPIID